MSPKEARILVGAYQFLMRYCIWRKIWVDDEDTHFEQLSFEFEEHHKFTKRTIHLECCLVAEIPNNIIRLYPGRAT